MKFGIFLLNQWPLGEDMATKISEAVEQVRAAKEAGFDILATGQHYLSYPYQLPASIPFLSRLAAEAEGMVIAPLVLLLPLLRPVDVAESMATLDAITGGRTIMGVGLGYREEENAAFDSPVKERLPRLLESLELIKQLWTQKEVEFKGEYYTLPRVKLSTQPLQKPHPPIWMAANADSAVKRAARQGYPWIINPHVTVATTARQIKLYRQEQKEAGIGPVKEMPMIREAFVSNEPSSAYEKARPYLEPKYEAYAAWGQGDVLPGEETFKLPFEDLARDRFLIGSPDDIINEVERYERDLGITHMFFRIQWPGMPHEEAMREFRLFRDHIIPHFKLRDSRS